MGVSVLAVGLWLGVGWTAVSAEDLSVPPAPERPVASTRSTAPTGQAGRSEQRAESDGRLSPLERLKRRSPEKRWAERAKEWLPTATERRHAKKQRRTARKTEVTAQAASGSSPSAAAPPFPDESVKLLPASAVEKRWSEYVSFRQPQPPQQYPEPARDPKQLKKITEILPYEDYEPDPETRRNNPCANLCPRPKDPRCQAKSDQTALVCPEEIRFAREPFKGRTFQERLFPWVASNIHYNPLYFEDVPLERYGHSHGDLIQPFVSVAKFGVQLVGLPYQMTIDPVRKKIYPLGYYRPGDCAPKKYYQIPFNLEAALREAGVWTALVFIFP